MGLSRYASRLAASSQFTSDPAKPSPGVPRTRENSSSSKISFGLFAYSDLQEPEDARLTGGTRSLSRRLLGLNLPMVPVSVPMPGSSPGPSVGATTKTAQSRPSRKSKAPLPAGNS